MQYLSIAAHKYQIIELPNRPKALLDRVVATIYQVETREINQAVTRNPDKFPDDFMFQLTQEEVEILKSQMVISNPREFNRNPPTCFTWEGCNMLATILKSEIATQYAIQIVRGFTQIEKVLTMAPIQEAEITLKSLLNVSNLLKVPEHLGMIESVKEVKKLTGIDYQPLLLQSSVMNNIPQEEEYLEPTELGKFFDKSAKEMNLILEELGMQVRISGVWNPTKLGKKYSVKHAWSAGTKSGYNYKWQVKEIRNRLERIWFNYETDLGDK